MIRDALQAAVDQGYITQEQADAAVVATEQYLVDGNHEVYEQKMAELGLAEEGEQP